MRLLAVFTFLIACAVLAPRPARSDGPPYPDRFVWLFGWEPLRRDDTVREISGLLDTAGKNGLNGVVFGSGIGSLSRQPPEYFQRLDEIRKRCESGGMEFIPAGFSVGYGGGVLGINRNLAEGLPVVDAPFAAGKDSAQIVPDPTVRIANGDFESAEGNRFPGYAFHDQPGEISFVDTQVAHGGKSSLRLENFGANPHGMGRVMQEVKVVPRRCYRVSMWVKTEGLTSSFRILALAKDREIAPQTFRVPATADWQRLTMLFNSLSHDSVRLYAGVWRGKAGRVWIDDWSVEEVGPLNVLRRPGTPITVRSDDGATTYEEGRDYAPLEDPRFHFQEIDRPAPPLRLLPGGRIREGQRLRVSWYHPLPIGGSQITLCMAEPELYAIWEKEVRLLAERVRPKRILLSMDEIRMGGTCAACRGKNMAALLGECITRLTALLRREMPGVQVYIWSDMLDPTHNAHKDYYLVDGDFTGSWNHVPKDLIVAIWGDAPRPESLRFFHEQGFKTLVACYYDADNLDGVRAWIRAAEKYPNVRGFMYTPWQRKYDLLPAFGQMLKAPPSR